MSQHSKANEGTPTIYDYLHSLSSQEQDRVAPLVPLLEIQSHKDERNSHKDKKELNQGQDLKEIQKKVEKEKEILYTNLRDASTVQEGERELDRLQDLLKMEQVFKELHEFASDPTRTSANYKEQKWRYHEIAKKCSEIPASFWFV